MEKAAIKEPKKVSNSFKQKWGSVLLSTFQKNSVLAIVLFFSFSVTHVFEIILNQIWVVPEVIYYSFLNDLYSSLFIAMIFFPVSLVFAVFGKKAMNYATSLVYFSLIIIHLSLTIYFFKSKVLLGGNLFNYSPQNIIAAISSAIEFNYLVVIVFFLSLMLIGFFAYYINYICKSSFLFSKGAKIMALIVPVIFLISFLLKKSRIDKFSTYENYLSSNKSWFFFDSVFDKYLQKNDGAIADGMPNNLILNNDSIAKPNDSIALVTETTSPAINNTPVGKRDIPPVVAQSEIKKTEAELKNLPTAKITLPNSESPPKVAVRAFKSDDFVNEKEKPADKGFYIVLGTFGNKKNAYKFKADVIHKGHTTSKIIQNKVSKLYYIFSVNSGSLDEAGAFSYKKEYSGVWILNLE